MADPVPEKIQKLFDGRLKAETEVKKVQNQIIVAVNNTERRVRVERLVTYCDELMTKAFSKKEHFWKLRKRPMTLHQHLPTWRSGYMRQL